MPTPKMLSLSFADVYYYHSLDFAKAIESLLH